MIAAERERERERERSMLFNVCLICSFSKLYEIPFDFYILIYRLYI